MWTDSVVNDSLVGFPTKTGGSPRTDRQGNVPSNRGDRRVHVRNTTGGGKGNRGRRVEGK